MRPLRTIQTSFTAGEVAPGLFARTEVARYYSGAALLRNLLVRPQGGVRRRPGMRHVATLAGGTDGIRLMPFAFNIEQTYAVALYSGAFAVFRRDAVQLATVTGCPWTATEARQMNRAQSADTLLLTHPDVQSQRIRRGVTEATWTRDALPYTNVPTHNYGAVTPSGTMTPSATSGTVTLTASVATFVAGHVGWELWGNSGRARITAVASGTSATAEVQVPFTNTTAIAVTDWTLREPVISASRGWPEAITFHQGRLWIGGFRSRPASFIASRVGDFFNLNTGAGLDDDAIYATIDSDQVNAIHQLASSRALQILTSGAEHVISGVPITPKTIERLEQTRRGIKRFSTAAEVDGALLFIQAGGAALRQFLYADTEAAWRSDLASLLAPHLILDPSEINARKAASADDADHVLLTNANGTVTVMTTLRAQEVTAFSRWETAGTILSACALQSGEVFFATLRNGTVRIEVWDEAALLDASVRQTSGTPFVTVTGLGHLNGLTVDLIGDGAYLGQAVVASGQVTLPRPVTSAEVGLNFDVRGRTLPIEPRDPSGHMIGRRMRVDAVTARVVDSGLFTIQNQAVVLRRVGAAPAAPLDTPPPRLTGDVTLRGLLGWRERADIEFQQPVPGPLTLLALGTNIKVAE